MPNPVGKAGKRDPARTAQKPLAGEAPLVDAPFHEKHRMISGGL